MTYTRLSEELAQPKPAPNPVTLPHAAGPHPTYDLSKTSFLDRDAADTENRSL